MAQTTKKSTTSKTNKSSSARKPAAKTQTKPKSTSRSAAKPATKPANKNVDRGGDPSLLRHQLMPYIFGLIALFLVICYIVSGSTGFIGGFLKKTLFGLFSYGAWAVPFLLLNTGIFWKHDITVGSTGYKAAFSTACLCFISVLIHAFTRVNETFNIITLFNDGANKIGGGVIGGFIGNLLLRGFGFAGTLILSIALILLFGIFLFGMTPHMFFVYILTGIREWREGMSSQLEAGRIEREALKLEYEKRRIAERQAALHAREEQLRSRTPNVTPNPSRRRADIDRNIYAEEAVVSGADVYNNEENVAASAVEVESSAPATAEPAVIDPSIVDDIMRRENEKLNRRSEPVDIDELADSNAAIPVESDSNVVESDAPPFAHESDGGDSADESETDSEKPVKLSFFRREKVKPLEKTASQKLDELETDEIDLSKIFVDPETAENPVVSNTSELAEAGEPPFDTSAEIDLIIEKSRVEASAKAGEPIGLPDEDDEPENSEPPFDVDDTAAAEPEPQPVSTPIVEQVKPQPTAEYRFPPIPLLNYDPSPQNADMSGEIQQTAVKLVETLRSFNVKTKIINVSRGPTITRYELQPEIGTKVRSILNLVDDIALHLATSGVRIEAPIPGKEAVGIEVPNKTTSMVYIRELIEDAGFKNAQSKVATCLGMDVAGNPVFLDIAKMPHILIAGTTGSGKSVCINSLIISILYKARPDEVKFILIDPKKVELNIYNGLPHLIVPVVSDPKKAAGSLHWAVTEMERRYELIEGAGVRNLKGYNQSIANDPTAERLPQIVIIIDELADLMMTAKDDVEESICRIAQKARAAGMHLVIGTQRPSVDVITGLIKANVPSRIAFTTVSQVDSRTIIDVTGAEKLIGRGDMLFSPVGSIKPIRVQGSFVSDEEVDAVTTFIKQNSGKQDYDQSVMESIEREAQLCGNKKATVLGDGDEEANDGDPMLKPAIQLAVESGKISTSLIQRRLQLGYGRAAKLIDMMEQMGIVGPPQGQKPREVLISKQDYMEMELRKE